MKNVVCFHLFENIIKETQDREVAKDENYELKFGKLI